MKHLVEAHDAMTPEQQEHIEVNTADHSVTFTIQDGPIKEVGENGCQAQDMMEFVTRLFESLNDAYPCEENEMTIDLLKTADHWQNRRNKDRIERGVEGKNQA